MSYIDFISYIFRWLLLVIASFVLVSVGFRNSETFFVHHIFSFFHHLCSSVGLLVLGLPPPTRYL